MSTHRYKDSNVRCLTDYCDCEDECDCEPSYYFTVNKVIGFGSVYYTEDHQGWSFYSGNFCGVPLEEPTMKDVHKQVDNIIATMWKCIG
jgi:hypothetical protein